MKSVLHDVDEIVLDITDRRRTNSWRQLLVAPDDRYAPVAELVGCALKVLHSEGEEFVPFGQQMMWGIGAQAGLGRYGRPIALDEFQLGSCSLQKHDIGPVNPDASVLGEAQNALVPLRGSVEVSDDDHGAGKGQRVQAAAGRTHRRIKMLTIGSHGLIS